MRPSKEKCVKNVEQEGYKIILGGRTLLVTDSPKTVPEGPPILQINFQKNL